MKSTEVSAMPVIFKFSVPDVDFDSPEDHFRVLFGLKEILVINSNDVFNMLADVIGRLTCGHPIYVVFLCW